MIQYNLLRRRLERWSKFKIRFSFTVTELELEGIACPESSIKTKSLNAKPCQQDYLPESYARRHLPSYQKCHKIVVPTRCGLFPFPWTFIGNSGDGNPTPKNLLISPIRKIPLNRFKSFAVKSFISSPSNSNFQVNILCNLHL